MVSSSSKSPKKTIATSQPSRPLTRSMLNSINSHKTEIPNVVCKQTARMRTMPPGEATKGKQLGLFPIKKETPSPLKPSNQTMKKIATSHIGRRIKPIRDESSDDEEGMGENYLGSGTVDDSDEEEHGDEDRHSFDDSDDGSMRSSDAESFTRSDNEDIAGDDGYDSDF